MKHPGLGLGLILFFSSTCFHPGPRHQNHVFAANAQLPSPVIQGLPWTPNSQIQHLPTYSCWEPNIWTLPTWTPKLPVLLSSSCQPIENPSTTHGHKVLPFSQELRPKSLGKRTPFSFAQSLHPIYKQILFSLKYIHKQNTSMLSSIPIVIKANVIPLRQLQCLLTSLCVSTLFSTHSTSLYPKQLDLDPRIMVHSNSKAGRSLFSLKLQILTVVCRTLPGLSHLRLSGLSGLIFHPSPSFLCVSHIGHLAYL